MDGETQPPPNHLVTNDSQHAHDEEQHRKLPSWQTVPSKKRILSPIEKKDQRLKSRKTSITDYMVTSNQYKELPIDEENQTENSNTQYVAKPPPIFIPFVSNVNKLTQLIKTSVTDFTVRIIANNQAKIQPATTEGYREIVKILQKDGAEFHTYVSIKKRKKNIE